MLLIYERHSIRTSIFYLETPDPENPDREQRVYCKWDPYFVRSLERFSSKGIIPPLSPEQEEAIQVLEATCDRVKLHMILDVGDIQFVSNSHTLHARTAYRDFPPDSGDRAVQMLEHEGPIGLGSTNEVVGAKLCTLGSSKQDPPSEKGRANEPRSGAYHSLRAKFFIAC